MKLQLPYIVFNGCTGKCPCIFKKLGDEDDSIRTEYLTLLNKKITVD